MNKKIVTFTMSLRQSQFEVDRLEIEANKMGIEVNRVLYRELSFDLENGAAKVFVRGEELTGENTLGLWFRVAGTRSGKYTEARNLIIRILREKGVFVVNNVGYLKWARMGKISQHGVFLENEVPIIPTKIFYTKEEILKKREDKTFFGWEYPVIAKHDRGYQGKSVRKFESAKQMRTFVKRINEKNLGMFLWQKYLPTRWDIRVIVVEGKAIGGMKRSAVGEEFRSNFSLGGDVEKWELSDDEKNLAEKVAKVCGLDYGGVDIMKDEKGNNYILEINRQCQFQGFEKSTQINVARAVVEMIKEKG
jgi:RimK family alpha-L-glutamate ligase